MYYFGDFCPKQLVSPSGLNTKSQKTGLEYVEIEEVLGTSINMRKSDYINNIFEKVLTILTWCCIGVESWFLHWGSGGGPSARAGPPAILESWAMRVQLSIVFCIAFLNPKLHQIQLHFATGIKLGRASGNQIGLGLFSNGFYLKSLPSPTLFSNLSNNFEQCHLLASNFQYF